METTSQLLAQIPTTSTPVPITSTAQASSGPPTSFTPVPITSAAQAPSGPTHGIYIAYQTAYLTVPQPPPFLALTQTRYCDEIWSGQWDDQAPLVPNYCNDAVATANEFTKPRTNSPPYPTTTISGIPLATTTNPKPTCNWIPDQATVGPGYLSCDKGPTSVSCEVASESPTSCVAEDAAKITPLIQCIWQAED